MLMVHPPENIMSYIKKFKCSTSVLWKHTTTRRRTPARCIARVSKDSFRPCLYLYVNMLLLCASPACGCAAPPVPDDRHGIEILNKFSIRRHLPPCNKSYADLHDHSDVILLLNHRY